MKKRRRHLACPICSKVMTSQGLGGHLRFAHHLSGPDIKKRIKMATEATVVSEPQRRKKTVTCPVCGKLMSPQGLSGHLRFAHELDAEEMREAMGRAEEVSTVTSRADDTVDVVDQVIRRVDRITALNDRLVQIRKKMKELEDIDESFLLSEDKAVKAAKKQLEAAESEILHVLEELGDDVSP